MKVIDIAGNAVLLSQINYISNIQTTSNEENHLVFFDVHLINKNVLRLTPPTTRLTIFLSSFLNIFFQLKATHQSQKE